MNKKEIKEKVLKPLTVVGLMSGSSLDGLDIAICRFLPRKDGTLAYEIVTADTVPYDPEWIENLGNAVNFSVRDYFSFTTDFSHYIAMMASDFCRIFKEIPDLVASHGHTIDHRPEDGLSVQIGDPAIISSIMAIDCVADFRIQDITLGGEGAPIIPVAEKMLWPEIKSFINLGGIANISVHAPDNIIAWDSVPCNQVLNDQAMIRGSEYDEGGAWARSGNLSQELYNHWDKDPYFTDDIPKSLDNNWIKDKYLAQISDFRLSPEDVLHTSCHFIADKIKQDYERYTTERPSRVMITGGGAHNTYLVECIKERLKEIGIEIFIPTKLVVDYKEAVMTALMGYLFAMDVENTIPSVTGASRAVVAGKYCKA